MTLREEIEAAGIRLPVRAQRYEDCDEVDIIDADQQRVAVAHDGWNATAIVAALNAAGEASDG